MSPAKSTTTKRRAATAPSNVWTDEERAAIVRKDLAEILGEHIMSRSAVPELVHVARWRRAMAQYAVGHQDRIKEIRNRVAELDGLCLAGNAYDGIGISDCIRLGRQAARELAAAKATAANL